MPRNSKLFNCDFDKIVGNKIRELRCSLGYSSEEIAELLDITYQQIRKYELGKDAISAQKLWKISKIFGENINSFFPDLASDDRISDNNANFRLYIEIGKKLRRIKDRIILKNINDLLDELIKNKF